MNTVRLTTDSSSVTLAKVAEGDFPVCIIGLELLETACKKARKALIAVAVTPELVLQREVECQALLDRFRGEKPLQAAVAKLGVSVEWLATLKAGLSLELDQTEALLNEQEELRLDPEDTSTRIKQLQRLLAELDVAGMAG